MIVLKNACSISPNGEPFEANGMVDMILLQKSLASSSKGPLEMIAAELRRATAMVLIMELGLTRTAALSNNIIGSMAKLLAFNAKYSRSLSA